MLPQKMRREQRERESECAHRRERPLALWFLFLYVFSSRWACPMLIGLVRRAVCSTRGPHSGPWTFLCSIFVGFSLPCLLATAILDYFILF